MNNHISSFLNQPLCVGNKTIEKRLVLAPMTQLGNIAFRELVSSFGGYGLLFSEMCGAKRIPHENRNISPYFRWRDEELPYLVCQIAGGEPEVMAIAARRIEDEGFFGVDINFGCSVALICRQNWGAALLKNPELAARIVDSVRKAVSIPVFVKFRTGWEDDPRLAVELAKRFEDAGADALTFHPRVAPDRRTRPPKWAYIKLIKSAVSIPVFGNGDVMDDNDCLKMLETTGCDGIAIGRIAVARPWIFAMWTKGLKPDHNIYFDAAIRMAALLKTRYDAITAIKRFKKFALYFSANFTFGHTLYTRILNAKNFQEIETVLCRFFENNPETVSRPNMNLFGG